MPLSARHLLSAAAVALVAGSAPATAGAATVLSSNACSGGDGQWGTLPLELSATAASSGRALEVSAVQPSVTIPSWLPAKVAPYGGAIALATGGTGSKSVDVDAWMAVTGSGSTDAPKVLKTTGKLRFTLGTSNFVNYTVTNPSLTLSAAAATTWQAPDSGSTINVAQGPAGSLPSIPGGAGNAAVQPKGSLWIRATISGVSLTIDCQPGTTADPQALTGAFTPAPAPAIVSAVFSAVPATVPPVPAPPAAPVPGPPVVVPAVPATVPPTPVAPLQATKVAPLAAGTLAIASPSLKFGSAALLVSIVCPAGGPDCTGSAAVKSAKKLRVGKSAAKLRNLASGTYSVKAGTTAPIKLRLTSDGKKLKRTALVATVTLKPTSGTAVTKRLRAN